MIIPWGRYAGRQVHELPIPYMRWCLERLENMPWAIRREMQRMVDAGPRCPRGQRQRHPRQTDTPDDGPTPRTAAENGKSEKLFD